jgi:UDP-N-acetylmuramoyl-tripeptide--D-alanyl-D-alanine ligase
LYADGADSEGSFSAIRAGDAIVIRRSFGSKMKTIVNAPERRFPGKTAYHHAAV